MHGIRKAQKNVRKHKQRPHRSIGRGSSLAVRPPVSHLARGSMTSSTPPPPPPPEATRHITVESASARLVQHKTGPIGPGTCPPESAGCDALVNAWVGAGAALVYVVAIRVMANGKYVTAAHTLSTALECVVCRFAGATKDEREEEARALYAVLERVPARKLAAPAATTPTTWQWMLYDIAPPTFVPMPVGTLCQHHYFTSRATYTALLEEASAVSKHYTAAFILSGILLRLSPDTVLALELGPSQLSRGTRYVLAKGEHAGTLLMGVAIFKSHLCSMTPIASGHVIQE